MFSIDIDSTTANCSVIRVAGRLSGLAPDQLKESVSKTLPATPQLVLDCSQLTYIDSTGLGAILASLRLAIAAGGDLRLAEVGRRIQAVMELVRADKVLSVYPTCDAALASYRP